MSVRLTCSISMLLVVIAGCVESAVKGSSSTPSCTPSCSGKSCGSADGCDGTCAAGSGCQSPAAAGTIVPLYSEPTSSYWSALIQAKNRHPTVPVIPIINPANGPGSAKDNGYTDGIAQLKAAGCPVIGYVYTGYGQRAISQVEAEVDQYHAWYPQLDGIMFDEMSNDPSTKAHYLELSNHAKSVGFTMTVGNPGTTIPADLLGVMDVVFVYESTGAPTVSSLAQWLPYRSQTGIIPYGVSTFDAAYVAQAKQDVGYIYLTDDDGTNPWDTLPAYFDALLAALEGSGSG